MANISNLIEEFILSVIGDDEEIQLSRNELANYFSVAPSQINYVLSTRFTTDRGFIIESRRGGGGCITLIRMEDESPLDMLNRIESKEMTARKAAQIFDRLKQEGRISENEYELICSAVSDKALLNVIQNKNEARYQMVKEIILCIAKKGGNNNG